jgi:predicted NAD/FAD-dependent oxidoreductase
VSGYAPADRTLISTTTLAKVSESEIALEIAKFWNLSPNELSIVGRYEIADSLPLFSPGDRGVQSAQVGSDIYLAGDYLSAGSQNGALLSGRLAALEALTH